MTQKITFKRPRKYRRSHAAVSKPTRYSDMQDATPSGQNPHRPTDMRTDKQDLIQTCLEAKTLPGPMSTRNGDNRSYGSC